MNAVERLLAHGEQLVSLLDEMYRQPSKGRWEFICFLDSVEQVPPSFKGEPRMVEHWWKAAVARVDANIKGIDYSASASAVLREWLSQRAALLDSKRWGVLVSDVVRDCRVWDFLAEDVVRLARKAADEAMFIEFKEQWGRSEFEVISEQADFRRTLGFLRRYATPPAAAEAVSTSEKQTANGRGRAGRPPSDEALARDLLDGWRAYEPEEGRKTKDRYLAERPDVRTLKTPEARQRKIASLLVTLNSALHLHREKTKQKRRARG